MDGEAIETAVPEDVLEADGASAEPGAAGSGTADPPHPTHSNNNPDTNIDGNGLIPRTGLPRLPTLQQHRRVRCSGLPKIRPRSSVVRPHVSPQPARRFNSSMIAGTTSCMSPITAYVALVTIGASASVLIARMVFELAQPAQCWMAPLMPQGM